MQNAKALAAAAFALAVAAGWCAEKAEPKTDGEIWNEGVEQYDAGDVTNALRTLRPLMLSKSHGPRAAEVVAAITHRMAHTPEAPDALKNLEESATAAQIALRAAPDDPRTNRNFTRATAGLAELRESKRMDEILKAAAGRDPGSILLESVREARKLMSESITYRDKPAEEAVAAADAMAARAEKLVDSWAPVRNAVAQSVTNAQQAATIQQQLDEARDSTAAAAKALGDMSDEAYPALADAEIDMTRFLKMTILPPAAMREDLVAQSNAWQDVEAFNGRDWQHDALDYTRAFRMKFPAWAREYEQRAQSDTNMPPFTAEAQAEISQLSTRLEKLQIECCEKPMPPSQEESIAIIQRILELLPPEKGGGGQQNQGQQNQQQNQDKQNQQQNQDKEQDQKQDQQDQDQQQDQQDQQQDQQDQQQEDQKDDSADDKTDKELETLLKKAQERNDEYEAEKKARMRKARLPPNTRDW